MSCGGARNFTSNDNCFFSASEYYFIAQKINKRAYKNRSLSTTQKTMLRQDLIKQITEKSSTISVQKEQIIEKGELGEYSSFLNEKSITRSMGSVNNAEFKYCKSSKQYFVYCLVSKKYFETDMYNALNAKVVLFSNEIISLKSAFFKGNGVYDDEKMNELSLTALFLSDGIELISASNYVNEGEKNKLVNQIAKANGQYVELKSLMNYSFEKQINRLNSLLLNNQYEKIYYELLSLSRKELNATQSQQISVLTNTYKAKLEGYINKLDTEIERAISNRDNSTTTEDLFADYESTAFYKDQFEKLERYRERLARRIGSGRTNLFFGLSAGSTFKQTNNSEGQLSVNEIDEELSFDQLLPAYEFGINHYFFNPKKRFGISATFRNYSDSFVDIATGVSPDGIKDFSALQFGVIFGQFELKHGLVNNNQELDGLTLSSLNWSILRTDKLMNRFTKSNFLKLSAFIDYLSDFEDRSYYQIGISLNYNLMFNRTSKY
tara:strand:+ start:786 stop:2264 length:1479 start_codon:yes stop_codon:yes gene_type:complete